MDNTAPGSGELAISDGFHSLSSGSEQRTPNASDDDLLARLTVPSKTTNIPTTSGPEADAPLLTRDANTGSSTLPTFTFGNRPQFQNQTQHRQPPPKSAFAVDIAPIEVSSDNEEDISSDETGHQLSKVQVELSKDRDSQAKRSSELSGDRITSHASSTHRTDQVVESIGMLPPSRSFDMTAPAFSLPQKRSVPETFVQSQIKRANLASIAPRLMADKPMRSSTEQKPRSGARADTATANNIRRTSSEGRQHEHTRASLAIQGVPIQPNLSRASSVVSVDSNDKREMTEALQILAHTWSKAQSTAHQNSKSLSRELTIAKEEISRLSLQLEDAAQHKTATDAAMALNKRRESEQKDKIAKLTSTMTGLQDMLNLLRDDARVQQVTLQAEIQEIAQFRVDSSKSQEMVATCASKSQKLNTEMVKAMQSMKCQLDTSQLSAEYLLAQLEEKTGLLVESRDELRALRAQQDEWMKPAIHDAVEPLGMQLREILERLIPLTNGVSTNVRSVDEMKGIILDIENMQQKSGANTASLSSLAGQIIEKLDNIEKKDDAVQHAQLILDIYSLKHDLLKIGVSVDNQKELQAENQRLTQKVTTTQASLTQVRGLNDTLQWQLSDARSTSKVFETQCKRITNALTGMSQGLGNDNDERLAIISSRLRELQVDLEDTEKEHDRCQAELRECAMAHEEAQLKVKTLEQESVDKDSRLASIRKALAEMRDSLHGDQTHAMSYGYDSTETFNHCHKDVLSITTELEKHMAKLRDEALNAAQAAAPRINGLTKKIQNLELEAAALRAQLETIEIEAVQRLEGVHQQEVEDLQAELSEALTKVNHFEDCLLESEASRSQQAGLIDKFRADLRSVSRQLETTEASASFAAVQRDAQQDIVRVNMLELGSVLSKTRRDLTATKADMDQLQIDLRQAEQDIEATADIRLELAYAEEQLLTMEDLKNRIADLELDKLEADDLRLDLAHTEEQLLLANDAAAIFKADVDKMREQEQERHRSELDVLKAEIKALLNVNETHQTAKDELTSKLKATEDVIMTLTAKHDLAESMADAAIEKYNKAEADNAELKAKQSKIQMEYDDVEVKLQVAMENLVTMNKSSSDDTATITVLRQEREEMKTLMSELDFQLTTQRMLVVDLHGQLESQELLKHTVKELTGELETIRNAKNRLEKEQEASLPGISTQNMLTHTKSAPAASKSSDMPDDDVDDLFSFLSHETQPRLPSKDKQSNRLEQTPHNIALPSVANTSTKRKRFAYQQQDVVDDVEPDPGDAEYTGLMKAPRKRTAVSRLKSGEAKVKTQVENGRGKNAKSGTEDWSDMLLSSNSNPVDSRLQYGNTTPATNMAPSGTPRPPLKATDANIKPRGYATRASKQNYE